MTSSRVSLITGAAGGIGLACVERFKQQGPLILADIVEKPLHALADQLTADGFAAEAVICDLGDPDGVQHLLNVAGKRSRLDNLVHTAGLAPHMADGRRVLELNLIGSARLVAGCESLVGEGSVGVLIASGAGHKFAKRSNSAINAVLDEPLAVDFFERLVAAGGAHVLKDAYGVSKLGVQRLAWRAAVPWGAKGARIVSISPGFIETPMTMSGTANRAALDRLLRATALGRTGQPDEIAAVVEFMCSEAASFVSGTDLRVDGAQEVDRLSD